MLIYETLIFNINLVYLSYKLWITDFNSIIPIYIYILLSLLVLLNSCETSGIFSKIYNSHFIKYTRNEKEKGITCGVNTNPLGYLFYCLNLTILFSYCYWILNILIRIQTYYLKIVVCTISITILYFIISNCAEYSDISRWYYTLPCLFCGIIYYFLIVNIKGSFTLSEGSIVAQGFTLLFNDSILYCTQKGNIEFHSIDSNYQTFLNIIRHPEIFDFDRSNIFAMLEVLIVGSIICYFILYPLFQRSLSNYHKWKDHHYLLEDRKNFRRLYHKFSINTWFGFIALIIICLMPYSTYIIKENPFIWVIKYICQPRRLFLISLWLCLLSSIVIAMKWLLGKTNTLSDLNNKRKFYHILSVLMFFPGYLIDRDFMFLSFAVAFCAMLMIEVIRYFKVYPVGVAIHQFMITFIDQKDTGTAILSHIYLLIGCGMPVWLNSLSDNILPGVSGILALGVGDTMASIIGYRYGKTHWPKSKKTVEGTCGFIASITLFVLITNIIYNYGYSFIQWIKFILFVILTGLLEAESNQNDNLILPLFLFSLTSTI